MKRTRQFQGFSRVIVSVLLILGVCGLLAAQPYSGGDGTSGTPYQLSTPTDLAALADSPADWGQWFVLTADLDLQSIPLATPIGSRALPFTGVFDGAGHRIRGLTINDVVGGSRPLGLFGVVGALGLVERLQLIAPSVQSTGSMSVGALAGELAEDATVRQCGVEQGSVSTPSADTAGGLIGDNSGTVQECYATGSITALGLVGGLVGRNAGTMENCGAVSAVTALKVGTGTAAGGLVGADIEGIMSFCYANSPSVTGARLGGLVGYASPSSVLTNSVCNQVPANAVGNWTADEVGSAWSVDANDLASAAFFTGLGWDLETVWAMDGNGVLRLRWMSGGPTAVIKGPTGAVPPDPQTGLAEIALDGTQSSDPEQKALTYAWRCLTSSGEATGIAIDPVASPTVRLPAGTYRIELTVSNGQTDSLPATITVTVGSDTSKTGPTAVAKGPAGVVRPDPVTGVAEISLDGTQSSDPGQKALQYTWKCLTATGEPTGITIGDLARPTVSLPVGVYRIELTVNNGTVDSSPAVLMVTVNAAPTAVIQAPSGTVGTDPATGLATITLDGSLSSDPEKDALQYAWKCLTADGEATDVIVAPVARPTVNLPSGNYRIELTVNDGGGDSAPAALNLAVGGVNSPPTAVIQGPIGAVSPDPATGVAQVMLDGSLSSDPDQDVLKYNWRCLTATGEATGITIDAVAKPSVSLRTGTYWIELTVNDGIADSAPAILRVTVADNAPPTAVIQGPTKVLRPDPKTGIAVVALDGSLSSDPDTDPLRYSWTCLTADGRPTGIRIDAVANPSINLAAGTYRIELTVNDGLADSAPAAVSVTVNTAPTARIVGPLEVVDEGKGERSVQLDGSRSSDPEAGRGQDLVYSWTCATASPGTASGPIAFMVFPVGVHKVQLVVSDGLESTQATTTVVVLSALSAARTAASPSTVGRSSNVQDVEFYLLLPAGKSVADVDTRAPITAEIAGIKVPLTRDPTYHHKKHTVAASVARKTVLDAVGATNGLRSAKVSVRLRTGETVFGSVNLQIVSGPGPVALLVAIERSAYYYDTQVWK